ncbi:hypothetical protein PHYPO_G00141020 [Pangasianodon hypophthalmus]|uniref:Uncharacterized protein n=1 Tax=Pangasianodon hypophthalmus TaxID=310915 RepID=A0A5N5KDV9_PANHP|nr:hypothetical protein PHYPO_G00141020 [Pangasianodon hypophthalmus]
MRFGIGSRGRSAKAEELHTAHTGAGAGAGWPRVKLLTTHTLRLIATVWVYLEQLGSDCWTPLWAAEGADALWIV